MFVVVIFPNSDCYMCRLVAAVYDDAAKLYTEMKKLDGVLAKFLERSASSDDEVSLDDAQKHATMADDMIDCKQDMFKQLGSMKSTMNTLQD